MMRPRSTVPPGPVGGGAARRSRGACAVTVAMILSGCSTLSESRSPTASVPPLVPPPAVAAHSPVVAPEERRLPEPRPAERPSAAQDRSSPRDEARTPTHHRRGSASPPRSRSGHALAIDTALTYVGAPYRWGGSTPAGFDCSGFVRHVYARSGIALPRTVAEQYRVGTPVHRGSLRPGDLVFFDRLRHNGIYIGRGEFVHASSGAGRVSVSRLDDDWFRHRWSGGRRMPSGTAAAGVTRAVTVGAVREAGD